ncbi:tRNA pseudouridine(55) synthase TruB [Cyanobium sp. CH-040]|uniref:tRNA pseudouridine(55) synthase TruB n=1 Tax=Cyanobium sp. CH-040 TaxID=2823708 RepID=UPI0020CC23EE|nr:tRNA pseudouridine(55) synthase TruB [Cyanobium sp. CH-040]MCP9928949.1 tRNA pseudouridine(55) synthase TruB [Cyanobium sp. CH-040]
MVDHPWGFLVLDKPAGPSSHACVGRVRRAYGLRRVGHGGTLDPAVTGVLPVALGSATRLLPYLEGDKSYRGVVQLGLATATDDLQGEVLERRPLPPLEVADLAACLERFRGRIEQVPPQVSAVHVDGQRAYQRVRQGETVALPPRPVHIHRLELLSWDPASGRLELEVTCSAGTYIRSLARDLGTLLGCGGTLASLRRTAALGFDLEQAVPLEALDRTPPPPLLEPLQALRHLPRQHLSPEQLSGWRCGRRLAAEPVDASAFREGQAVVIVAPDGNLAGMARATADGQLQPKLVLEAAG